MACEGGKPQKNVFLSYIPSWEGVYLEHIYEVDVMCLPLYCQCLSPFVDETEEDWQMWIKMCGFLYFFLNGNFCCCFHGFPVTWRRKKSLCPLRPIYFNGKDWNKSSALSVNSTALKVFRAELCLCSLQESQFLFKKLFCKVYPAHGNVTHWIVLNKQIIFVIWVVCDRQLKLVVACRTISHPSFRGALR